MSVCLLTIKTYWSRMRVTVNKFLLVGSRMYLPFSLKKYRLQIIFFLYYITFHSHDKKNRACCCFCSIAVTISRRWRLMILGIKFSPQIFRVWWQDFGNILPNYSYWTSSKRKQVFRATRVSLPTRTLVL